MVDLASGRDANTRGCWLVLQLLAADDASVAMQPSGTVTLVFTDIEGSTALLDELGAEAFREALADHRRASREAFGAHAGYEVDRRATACSTRSRRRRKR